MHYNILKYPGTARQQIDDLVAETARLKDVVKKKEENEKKYQGELRCDGHSLLEGEHEM